MLDKSKRAMKEDVKNTNDVNQLIAYRNWVENSIATNKKSIAADDDRNTREVMTRHNKWLESLLDEIDQKINKLK